MHPIRSVIICVLKCAELCPVEFSQILDRLIINLCKNVGQVKTGKEEILRGMMLYGLMRVSRDTQRLQLLKLRGGERHALDWKALWGMLLGCVDLSVSEGYLVDVLHMPGLVSAIEVVCRAITRSSWDSAEISFSLEMTSHCLAASMNKHVTYMSETSLIGTITKLQRIMNFMVFHGYQLTIREGICLRKSLNALCTSLTSVMQTPRENTKSEFMLLKSLSVGSHLVSPFAIKESDCNVAETFPNRHDRLSELRATHDAHDLVSCSKSCHNSTCMNLEGISESAMMTILCRRGCRRARYCSLRCQNEDLEAHKGSCILGP